MTPQNLHKSTANAQSQRGLSYAAPGASASGCVDPSRRSADQTAGMLQRFEAVPMHALLLARADHPLDQAVLLGAVWRDELLAQPVASDQRREALAGEYQSGSALGENSFRNPWPFAADFIKTPFTP